MTMTITIPDQDLEVPEQEELDRKLAEHAARKRKEQAEARKLRQARADRKYITTSQLCKRWGGCSHMTVERKLKNDPSFPRPYFFTRVRMFDIGEIEEYEGHAAREPKRERA